MRLNIINIKNLYFFNFPNNILSLDFIIFKIMLIIIKIFVNTLKNKKFRLFIYFGNIFTNSDRVFL